MCSRAQSRRWRAACFSIPRACLLLLCGTFQANEECGRDDECPSEVLFRRLFALLQNKVTRGADDYIRQRCCGRPIASACHRHERDLTELVSLADELRCTEALLFWSLRILTKRRGSLKRISRKSESPRANSYILHFRIKATSYRASRSRDPSRQAWQMLDTALGRYMVSFH